MVRGVWWDKCGGADSQVWRCHKCGVTLRDVVWFFHYVDFLLTHNFRNG